MCCFIVQCTVQTNKREIILILNTHSPDNDYWKAYDEEE